MSVLIEGETGSGKEVAAHALHAASSRNNGPFVVFDCAATNPTLMASELFGHEKGAFTGAANARPGQLEEAEGGTLFLDEIGEMSPAMQVRLLRALDSGEVRRVGEERSFHVNVRIVAATAKELTREATEGRFRWDLFYRVSTVVVEVPALRQRREDIPQLVQHFLTPPRSGKTLAFARDALERLITYDWPGNIRELRNLVERLQILHEGSEVRASDLPVELRRAPEPVDVPDEREPALVPLAHVERRHVERVLAATGWNKARAARVLEVDVKTLNKKIRDFNLVRPA
jgi:two-component system response regulator HydG